MFPLSSGTLIDCPDGPFVSVEENGYFLVRVASLVLEKFDYCLKHFEGSVLEDVGGEIDVVREFFFSLFVTVFCRHTLRLHSFFSYIVSIIYKVFLSNYREKCVYEHNYILHCK